MEKITYKQPFVIVPDGALDGRYELIELGILVVALSLVQQDGIQKPELVVAETAKVTGQAPEHIAQILECLYPKAFSKGVAERSQKLPAKAMPGSARQVFTVDEFVEMFANEAKHLAPHQLRKEIESLARWAQNKSVPLTRALVTKSLSANRERVELDHKQNSLIAELCPACHGTRKTQRIINTVAETIDCPLCVSST